MSCRCHSTAGLVTAGQHPALIHHFSIVFWSCPAHGNPFLKAHLESGIHDANIRHLAKRREADAARKQLLSNIYDDHQLPNPAFQLHQQLPRPSMFSDSSSPILPDVHGPNISMGMEPACAPDVAAAQARLDRLAEQMRSQALYEEEFGDSLDEDPEMHDLRDRQEEAKRWRPYPDKITMLLDIVDNLPRLRMSSAQFHIILWLLNECGVPDIPSYDTFRKRQKDINKTCGTAKTQAHTSTLGNKFFTNNIADSIAMDFSNPEIAPHLNFYPEETSGPISEVWQAERWKEFKANELTPMFSRGLKQFFIEELCQLDDTTYVIPHLWIIREGKLCADCSEVAVTPHGWSISATKRSVQATKFLFNYYDIISRVGSTPKWADDTQPPEMPNPIRSLAPGRDIYVVMAPIWADDVSGNRSKQYNKHMNMYMANSNLPGRLLQQEYFVRFVSTSPHASSPEQFAAVRDQINATQKEPIICYNADTKRECAVIVRCPGLPADNPQQAEEASHIGGNGNFPCRKCEVGGTQKEKQNNDAYHAHHLVGVARDAGKIKAALHKQLQAAMTGIDKRVTDLQKATGTKDKVTQYWIDELLKKARVLKKSRRPADDISRELRLWLDAQPGDKMNPLLSISGLDPSQDTPVEILHTILLGVVKYAWYILHTSWSEDERNLFAARLQCTDIDGLSIAPIRAFHLTQYRNNLIGKDFKMLMQTTPFHVHGISEATEKHPDRFTLVKAVGELGAALWVHEIKDMEMYLADLEVLTANVLDAFGDVDCKKILVKIKLHLLPHLIDDIRRFGPAIRNSTEVFECFNAVFRLCSVLSNHQAPSRDIAQKFTSMDRVKHILSGGYWKEGSQWVQAGSGVRSVLRKKPIIQRYLGWVPDNSAAPGTLTLAAERHGLVDWASATSIASDEVGIYRKYPLDSRWRHAQTLIAKSGDVCRPGSWVFFHSDEGARPGRINVILVPADPSCDSRVLLELFDVGHERHPHFNAPVLGRPPDGQAQYVLAPPSKISFLFSAQHDCRTVGCQEFDEVSERQERQETPRSRLRIRHVDDSHYIVNIYALHNASKVREAIGRYLTKPIPLYNNRRAHHDVLAAKLRGITGKKLVERRRARDAKAAAALESEDLASQGAVDEEEEEEDLMGDEDGGNSTDGDALDGDSTESEGSGVEDDTDEVRPPRKRKRT
ncbi:hypothetical protein EV121DRAFT_283734 [Schizophyllum commune]